jgi:hypothetical protein
MSIVKPRTRGKEFVPFHTRLYRENQETVYAYAAYINEDVEYVINELIVNGLEKERDFATWRAEHRQSYAPPRPMKRQRGRPAAAASATAAHSAGGRERHVSSHESSGER